MLLLGLRGREPFGVARSYSYGWVGGGRKVPVPLARGLLSVPAVYSRLDCREGMTRGSAATDAALVVFFLCGLLPLLALRCSSPHGRRTVGARVHLAPASTARVSSKEETQVWTQSLRARNTTNVLMVEKMDRSRGSITV